MSFQGLLEMCYLFTFLLAGYYIREYCKPIQKYYIPSAVVGGIVALILGPCQGRVQFDPFGRLKVTQ